MPQHGLRARVVRRYQATTHSPHNFPVAKNVWARQFTETRLHPVRMAAITYGVDRRAVAFPGESRGLVHPQDCRGGSVAVPDLDGGYPGDRRIHQDRLQLPTPAQRPGVPDPGGSGSRWGRLATTHFGVSKFLTQVQSAHSPPGLTHPLAKRRFIQPSTRAHTR